MVWRHSDLSMRCPPQGHGPPKHCEAEGFVGPKPPPSGTPNCPTHTTGALGVVAGQQSYMYGGGGPGMSVDTAHEVPNTQQTAVKLCAHAAPPGLAPAPVIATGSTQSDAWRGGRPTSCRRLNTPHVGFVCG